MNVDTITDPDNPSCVYTKKDAYKFDTQQDAIAVWPVYPQTEEKDLRYSIVEYVSETSSDKDKMFAMSESYLKDKDYMNDHFRVNKIQSDPLDTTSLNDLYLTYQGNYGPRSPAIVDKQFKIPRHEPSKEHPEGTCSLGEYQRNILESKSMDMGYVDPTESKYLEYMMIDEHQSEDNVVDPSDYKWIGPGLDEYNTFSVTVDGDVEK